MCKVEWSWTWSNNYKYEFLQTKSKYNQETYMLIHIHYCDIFQKWPITYTCYTNCSRILNSALVVPQLLPQWTALNPNKECRGNMTDIQFHLTASHRKQPNNKNIHVKLLCNHLILHLVIMWLYNCMTLNVKYK